MRPDSALVLGLCALLLFCACSGGGDDLAPSAPDRVGNLRKMEPPPADTQYWSFAGSALSWKAAYADSSGNVRLRIYAFTFADRDAAGAAYESSRMHAEASDTSYSEARERRIEGVEGLRLVDDRGTYFEFHRGDWLIVLSAAGDGPLAAAVRAIPWARPGS